VIKRSAKPQRHGMSRPPNAAAFSCGRQRERSDGQARLLQRKVEASPEIVDELELLVWGESGKINRRLGHTRILTHRVELAKSLPTRAQLWLTYHGFSGEG
jgi:hypothetical protein